MKMQDLPENKNVLPDTPFEGSEIVLVTTGGSAAGYVHEEHTAPDADMRPVVYLNLQGMVNGSDGTEARNTTYLLSPKDAAIVLRNVVYSMSTFPEGDLGFDMDEIWPLEK